MDSNKINLTKISTFTSENGAEIVAHDPTTQRLFVTTGDTVEIIDISNPNNPTKVKDIDITSIGGGANSVAVKNGIVAVAVEAKTTQDPGLVAFYDTNGNLQNTVTVGALPDMLTFSPDGKKVLVANEGEPNDEYTIDPEGSISIIDISGGVSSATATIAGFTGFNDQKQALIDKGVHISGPNATVAQDLEPEYIAVSPDGATAFVTLQENNAVAVLDIETATVQDVLPLGVKDHSKEGNKLDASNKDDAINIQSQPVFGLYQPDEIDSFEAGGKTYYITANEGAARDYDGFSEEERIKDLTLDPSLLAGDNANLQDNDRLGRLKVTNALGDLDGDGDFDQLFSFGGRSFSIWDESGNQVFDSGDQIAKILEEQTPDLFNADFDDKVLDANGNLDFSDTSPSFGKDDRSDDKGAEAASVTVGSIDGKNYGFIALERAGGGVLVYDLSDPTAPKFNQYIRTEGDVKAEGLKFIAAEDSPDGNPVLAVSNEVSNTTTLYGIEVANSSSEIPIITPTVGGTIVEMVDLRDRTGQVTVDFTISREANFENEIYFYKVDDITGTVGGVQVDSENYLQAVLDNIISPEFSTSNNNTESGSVEFEAGSLVAPMIIADSTLEEAQSGNATVYFPYLGASGSDGFDHIKLLDDGSFGFEDLPNGGDQDFNDITIAINRIA